MLAAATLAGLLALSQTDQTTGPAQPAAAAQPIPPAPPVVPVLPKQLASQPAFALNLTTLDLLHKKGTLSDAEYAQAMQDLIEYGTNAGAAPTFVLGKFSTTLFGFVEADFIHDSTRSFVDLAGGSNIQQPLTEQGSNGRTMFGARNSRLGLRINAPEFMGFRPSAWIESDFLGNQPGNPPQTSAGSSFKEAPFFNNPTFRIRHMVLKLDNDIVSVWFGQTWELLGFQGQFQPNTVEIQGVPGELYARTPQMRLVHDFKFGDLATLEIAVAALRPPQEDSQIPDLQGGLKLSIDGWKGRQTVGATGTSLQPAAIAISGATRWYQLATGATKTTWNEQTVRGQVLAGDLMIPAIPPSLHLPVALTLIGESTFGTGDADLFTNLTGGATVNTPAGFPTGAGAPAYPQAFNPGIDPGLAGFNATTGQLETIDWRSVLVGMQLYLPPDYKLWISANYSNIYSQNISDFGKGTVGQEWWADVNVFFDLTSSVRLGVEYAHFADNYVNGVQAPNERLQFSGFFIF